MSYNHSGGARLNSGMRLSVGVAIALFLIKITAWFFSGSIAVLGDAAESVVHLFAILFAAYSLGLSQKNPDRTHPYGFAKISFFSSGLEGGLIIIAGVVTIAAAIIKLIFHESVKSLEIGTVLIALAALINFFLGYYLVRLGKKQHSIIVESNGRHTLADSYTSIAVVMGLLLYSYTGLSWIDPIFGILIAAYIIFTGVGLCQRAFDGLMDKADPVITKQLTEVLSERCAKAGIRFHELRHRHDGERHLIDLHLLFPCKMEIGEAHHIASEIEITLISSLSNRAHIMTHLESIEEHEDAHK